MKLLLTSTGITNDSMKKSLYDLLGEEISKAQIAFIPTAATAYADTSWLEADILILKRYGIKSLEMVELSKLSPAECLEKCIRNNVIWFHGGNTYYLLDWVRRSGLAKELPNLLKDRVYVGASAGSMIAGPTIETNTPFFPEEDEHKLVNLVCLSLSTTEFCFRRDSKQEH